MIIGKVIGSLVSTIKHDCYQNMRLMMVKPINPDGTEKSGVHIAVDTVDAGPGDIVLMASEGRAAQEILGFSDRQPLRSVITAIVDSIDYEPHTGNND